MTAFSKWCPRCDVTKPLDDFYARTRWPDGTVRYYKSYCKACDNRARKAWEHANPEKAREWARNGSLRRRRDPERGDMRRAYERDYQEKRRRAAGVPPRVFRSVPVPDRSGEFLPVGPFAEFLRRLGSREGLNRRAVARLVGLSEETVRRILNGHQALVDAATVDAALCREGSLTLRELYPVALNAQGE
jgi:hypothetical protein